MRKRYSRSYTVLSFLTMFSYRELPFGGRLILQVCCHFSVIKYDLLHERMLRMFQMYGIFGEVRQMFFSVFGYFAHIRITKFGYLFSEKGKTKKTSMI